MNPMIRPESSARRSAAGDGGTCVRLSRSEASVSASARRLDRDDVAGGERPGRLRGQFLAAEQIPPRVSGLPAPCALWRKATPLAYDREAARLERAQLAHDPVSAPPGAAPARSAPELVTLDPHGIGELQRLH